MSFERPYAPSERTHIVQDDQWTVDTTDSVVPDPRRHGHHPRVETWRHRCRILAELYEEETLDGEKGDIWWSG